MKDSPHTSIRFYVHRDISLGLFTTFKQRNNGQINIDLAPLRVSGPLLCCCWGLFCDEKYVHTLQTL